MSAKIENANKQFSISFYTALLLEQARKTCPSLLFSPVMMESADNIRIRASFKIPDPGGWTSVKCEIFLSCSLSSIPTFGASLHIVRGEQDHWISSESSHGDSVCSAVKNVKFRAKKQMALGAENYQFAESLTAETSPWK